MYIYQIETLFSNNIFCLNLELTCDYCNYYNSIDVCLALTTINFYLTLPILIIEAKCLHRLFGHCLDYVWYWAVDFNGFYLLRSTCSQHLTYQTDKLLWCWLSQSSQFLYSNCRKEIISIKWKEDRQFNFRPRLENTLDSKLKNTVWCFVKIYFMIES